MTGADVTIRTRTVGACFGTCGQVLDADGNITPTTSKENLMFYAKLTDGTFFHWYPETSATPRFPSQGRNVRVRFNGDGLFGLMTLPSAAASGDGGLAQDIANYSAGPDDCTTIAQSTY